MITTENVIHLREAEVAENYTRMQWAEDLILHLPPRHANRDGWLMTYGVKAEAVALREKWLKSYPNEKRPSHWPSDPVDPDLISARKLSAEIWPSYAGGYLNGNYDTDPVIQAVLAGIKLGREQKPV